MAVLDTSFLIDLLRGKEEISSLKERLERTESILAVTTPSIMELWHGSLLGRRSNEKQSAINELIQSLTILSFDEKSSKLAGEIQAGLMREGLPIEVEDMMIAGVCMSHGEILVTSDAHFTRIPGLQIIKY